MFRSPLSKSKKMVSIHIQTHPYQGSTIRGKVRNCGYAFIAISNGEPRSYKEFPNYMIESNS